MSKKNGIKLFCIERFFFTILFEIYKFFDQNFGNNLNKKFFKDLYKNLTRK